MVFPCHDEREDCGCPRINPSRELDFWGGNDHTEANAAHMRLCLKWDALTEAPR